MARRYPDRLPEVCGRPAVTEPQPGSIELPGFAPILAALWSRRQWVAVVAVLGCLLAVPSLGWDRPIVVMIFMSVITLAAVALQRALGGAGLLLTGVMPTAVYFVFVICSGLLPGGRALVNPQFGLAFAGVLAAAGLGIAVLHQRGPAAIRTAAVASLVALNLPLMLAIWAAGPVFGVSAAVTFGLAYTFVGLAGSLDEQVRAAAVPLGTVLLVMAVIGIASGRYWGYSFFAFAAASFALAAVTGFRPFLVMGWLLALVGVPVWLPALIGFFQPASAFGTEWAAESVLGLAAALLGARALRVIRGDWVPALTSLTWAISVIFGSVAVVVAGAVIGARVAQPYTGFRAAHVVVTIAWFLLGGLLALLGLRRDLDGSVAVRLAVAFTVVAALKLFGFDATSLPDLVRVVAFLGVSLTAVIGAGWLREKLSAPRSSSPEWSLKAVTQGASGRVMAAGGGHHRSIGRLRRNVAARSVID